MTKRTRRKIDAGPDLLLKLGLIRRLFQQPLQ
jgi:hypothetical protein